jgi:hypothetical protein
MAERLIVVRQGSDGASIFTVAEATVKRDHPGARITGSKYAGWRDHGEPVVAVAYEEAV